MYTSLSICILLLHFYVYTLLDLETEGMKIILKNYGNMKQLELNSSVALLVLGL